MGIVIVGNAKTPGPGRYEREVAELLAENPGASYLRTDRSCSSLKQSDGGNPINAVYYAAGYAKSDVCRLKARIRGAGNNEAYGKWLDNETPWSEGVDCSAF